MVRTHGIGPWLIHGSVVSLGDFVIPRGTYAGPRPPIHYNDTPSYNDPSKFGGQSLGMDP